MKRKYLISQDILGGTLPPERANQTTVRRVPTRVLRTDTPRVDPHVQPGGIPVPDLWLSWGC